jgi:hypothetical protein
MRSGKATIPHNTVIFSGRDHDIEDGCIMQFVSGERVDYLIGDTERTISEAGTALPFYRHMLCVNPTTSSSEISSAPGFRSHGAALSGAGDAAESRSDLILLDGESLSFQREKAER